MVALGFCGGSQIHYRNINLKSSERVQDGNQRVEADSMSSVSQKFCRDTGATLCRKKMQEESKLQHPKPPTCAKLLHATLH
jgi:hypothetical protein